MESFPEGEYLLEATTSDGGRLVGIASLSYEVAPAPRLQTRFESGDLVVAWSGVDGADGYVVEIDSDELGFKLTAVLEADVGSDAVPSQLLQSGMEYEVSVGTLSDNGNSSVGESCVSHPKPSTAE